MKFVLPFFAAVALLLWGCAQEERKPINLPPPEKPPQEVESKLLENTLGKPVKKKEPESSSVETVDNPDLEAYGVPVYPGATIDKEKSPGLKTHSKSGEVLLVTMETTDLPRKVVEFYRDHLDKVTEAMASGTFGGVEGFSKTGHNVTVSVFEYDDKNTIVLKIKT